jgi:hypothetical protein
MVLTDGEELDGAVVNALRRAIAEPKQRSQWSVIGWVTKIYYLELLHASEGTLVPAAFAIASAHSSFKEGRRPIVKIIAESLSQHDKNMLYRPYLVE